MNARQWAFLGLFVTVLAAMLAPWQPEVAVTDDTRKLYEFLDSLPAASVLLVSFDHEAAALPEIRPLALAVIRHAFSRGHRLVGMALMAEGTGIGYRLMQQCAEEYQRVYGRDYAYLGFKPQTTAAILALGESIHTVFQSDYLGTSLDNLPVLDSVDTYDDIAAVLSIADGNMPTHWMEYAGARFGVRVVSAMTAAMITTFDPYVASGQLTGLVGGLRGAAEYEDLLKVGSGGRRGMLAQAWSHLYVLLLIAIGNVLYFRQKRGRAAT